jgi:acyl carrier protein
MNIFQRLDNYLFGIKSYDKSKSIDIVQKRTEFDEATEDLHNLKLDLMMIASVVAKDYAEVVRDIQEAKEDNVPMEELQFNLGEKQALTRVLNVFVHQKDCAEIVQEALTNTLDVSTVDNHQPTHEEIFDFVKTEMETITGFHFTASPGHVKSLTFPDIGIDSRGFVELVINIEEQFGIELENEALLTVKTIDNLIDLIIIATAGTRD